VTPPLSANNSPQRKTTNHDTHPKPALQAGFLRIARHNYASISHALPLKRTQKTRYHFGTRDISKSKYQKYYAKGIKMLINRLKDHDCRKATPSATVKKIYDGGGLYLAVLPSGNKVWRVAYLFSGKAQTKVVGHYPALSLAEARVRRDAIKMMLRDGGDPMAERKAKRNADRKRDRRWMSLDEAAKSYWANRQDISPSYRHDAIRAVDIHISPSIGQRDIASLTREDVLDVLQAMNARGLFVYVRKVRMWLDQIFEWAVENRYATINPARLIDPKKAFGRTKVKHFSTLELDEVPDFLSRLRMERDLQSVLACRLLALTWTRTSELRMMEWDEIRQDIWVIPASKMKRTRDHLVPLSRQALALLDALRSYQRTSRYVFPAEHRMDRPMSENAILYLIYRIGYKGRLTGHGFRSIASTWANERGYNPDAIERQLAHAPDDKVRSAYNRAEYLPLRRQMLQDFADWLESHEVDPGGAQSG
jgi:integrase